jgi:hypothetical protein
MFDANPARTAGESSQPSAPRPSLEAPPRGFIQCPQCSEQFGWTAIYCPRCHVRNHRSPLAVGIKILAFAVFVAALSWTVWAVRQAKQHPEEADSLRLIPRAAGNDPDQLRTQY